MRIVFWGDSLTLGVPGSSYFAILRQELPDDTLINLGRGNDTVVSLYRRAAALQVDEPFDLAFLWVGVNDVPRRTGWLYQAANSLVGQRRARDLDEFRTRYRSTLDLLGHNAARVIAVSPALKGEDTSNRWNRQLEVLSGLIAELVSGRDRVEFLDLQTLFAGKLAGKPTSSYLPSSALRVTLDALMLRSKEQIDRKAASRGLHLTLDGLHLNSTGAQLVAETFLEVIRNNA